MPKYEFRVEVDCSPDEAEWLKDYLLDLNEDEEMEPRIKEVTYDIKKEQQN